MRLVCCKRPLWWFISAGVLFALGIVLVVFAAVSKTVLYDNVVGGLYNARFIDNTNTIDACSTVLIGDITCPGKRFQGWKMSTHEKLTTCMLPEAPSSKSLSSAAKWCEDGKSGCQKPNSCKAGSKYSFYFFNVLNADEVLRGLPALVKEMEPIGIRKAIDKFSIDENQWNADGIAKWSENSTWEIIDESQRELLEQVIVIPNPSAFVAIPSREGMNTRMTTENVMYMAAASKLYTRLQASITKIMTDYGIFVQNIFSGTTAINWRTMIKDAYRDGSPIRKLGDVFANEGNCSQLMRLLTRAGLFTGSADFFSMMMCTNAYQDNVALSAYSRIFSLAKISITPDDGLLFYEYEKNCRNVNEKPSYLCKSEMMCPDASTRAECIKPSLSEDDVDALFGMFERVNDDFESAKPELFQFVDSCTIGGHQIQPRSLCDSVHQQLQKAGHAALFSANPESGDAMAAYGWTDKTIAATMIPYFLNGTVAQLMGYQGRTLPEYANRVNGLLQWLPKTQANVNPNVFTRQQVSSRFGDKGLNYFKSAMGLDQSCAFSYRCMDQNSFKLDGRTCSANDQCMPNYAQGYDVGVSPGYFFGSKYGTDEFHSVGAEKTLFVSDLFVQANFKQVETDAAWGNIRVDKWNVSKVGMRTENCDAADPMDRGIDCSSPIGTINVGYNSIYGEGKTPNDMILPFYSSFPHFQEVAPDSPRRDTYHPLDKVEIRRCDSCPADRDFMTFLWNDPETGTDVRGSQKIQLNVRVSANPANITRLPNSVEAVHQDGSAIIDPSTDVMIPVYWIDKYDTAADYQKETVAFIQSVPKIVNIVFWVGLWVGILFLAIGGVLLWHGLRLRKLSATSSQAELTKNVETVEEKVEIGEMHHELTGNVQSA
jgi:hypothetical protein